MVHRVGTVSSDLHLENGVLAFARDAFNRNAREREFVRQTTVVDRKVNEIFEALAMMD
jgi:hypothetical protein